MRAPRLRLIVGSLMVVGIIHDPLAVAAAPPAPVRITIDNRTSTPTRPINRLLLGNNIAWVQRGEGLLLPDSLTPNPDLLARLIELAPTAIRYPGGSFADLFHWQAAMGPLQNRGMIENFFTGVFEPADFGTAEFLELCQHTGATPLITVNAMTGDAAEAAAWVTATNIDRIPSPAGGLLPAVPLWEIGNEPYLTGERPDIALSASEFAARVNSFIPAMRSVDPSIELGVPLAGELISQFLPPPDNIFNETVLSALTVEPDYFAIHDAYLPFYYGPVPTLAEIYLQTIAGAWVVNQDLDALRARVDARFPGRHIPFALTEYSALYTLNSTPSDGYIASFASALYVADLTMMLAQRDDIRSAEFFSLLDNWYFGALDSAGRSRPAFAVLAGFSKMWHGDILPTQIITPTFDVPPATGYGAFPGVTAMATVSTLVLRDADTIRVILLNKDPIQPLLVQIQLASPAPIEILTSQEYDHQNLFETFLAGDNRLDWQPASARQSGGVISLTLRAHSLRTLEFTVPHRIKAPRLHPARGR